MTIALARVERREPGASEELWEFVYQDLRGLAAARLRKQGAEQTLQATALVNEVWLRLGADAPETWEGRAHFFGAAAISMRNILVDRARRKHRLRRNEGVRPEPLHADVVLEAGLSADDLLALDEALTALGEEYERPAQIVMLRFFAGRSIAEVAEFMGVTTRTVDRELLFARTWLRRFLDRR